MRGIICSFIFILSLFYFACKDNISNTSNGNVLVGIWQLKQQSGGFIGQTIYFSDTPKYLLQISIDNKYIETRNDTITFSDSFTTYNDSTYKKQVIDFVNSKRFRMIVEQVTPDSLILWDGLMDGYTSFYIRIK